MSEYMDCEYTEYDVKHGKDPIPTYDKDIVEQVIKRDEKIFKRKLTEQEKERIRKSYKYIGK